MIEETLRKTFAPEHSSQEWGTNEGHSKGAPDRQQPIPRARGQLLFQPTASDHGWQRLSSRRWATPAEHAMAILDLLQGPGGRTGTFTCTALKRVHTDICLEQGFEPIRWTAVGRELRKVLGADKEYQRINGRQVRVYRIPPRLELTTQACGPGPLGSCVKQPSSERSNV